MTTRPTAVLSLFVLAFGTCVCAGEEPAAGRRSLEDVYKDYQPSYGGRAGSHPPELMKVSLQANYYNRAHVAEDKECIALVQAGLKAEAAGDHAEAIRRYQAVLDKHPEALIPVGTGGAFVSAARYVQERLLGFPTKQLDYYRLQYDPQAREIYERALAGFNVNELHHLAEYSLATTYGTKALYELGRRALDAGHDQEAAGYFRRILQWHRSADVDGFQVKFLLAYACKQLGREEEAAALSKELAGDTTKPAAEKQRRQAILSKLTQPAPAGEFVQRVNPKYLSFGDYAALAPLAEPLYSLETRWRASLPQAPAPTIDDRNSGGEMTPFHVPWIVGNSMYFKHYNRVYCRSLVNGRQRWAFELGPLDREIGRNGRREINSSQRLCTVWETEQSILVDEQMVYANIGAFERNESLVALDRVTGQLQWVAGALAPQDERDLAMRYDATPALGRQAVYAPWSYQQGEGRNHLYSTAGVTAFDKTTGRVLWRKELARLVPTATTQERRGIRIYSSPPLVKDGVIYCCTNAGVLAALDADSGSVRWLVRYPHIRYRDNLGMPVIDGHDFYTLRAINWPETYSPRFACQPPILKDGRLYVAPADGEEVYCFDQETGKALWNFNPPEHGTPTEIPMAYLAGITPDNELIVSGGEVGFYDLKAGHKTWSFLPSWFCTWGHNGGIYYTTPFVDNPLHVLGRPTLTADGNLHFSGNFAQTIVGPVRTEVYGEWCLSTTKRRLLAQRYRFGETYKVNSLKGLQEQIRDSREHEKWSEQTPAEDVNAPFPFEPVRRLPFLHHGVPFEVVTDGQSLAGRFDLDALREAVAKDDTPAALFTRAEILVEEGREDQAAAAFERAKAGLKPEERALRREIDLELFRLYRNQAWKALLAGDAPRARQLCLQLGQTAVTAPQEIQALLAMADSFERAGKPERAAACLQLLIKHQPHTVYPINRLTLDDPAKLSAQLGHQLDTVGKQKPRGMEGAFSLAQSMVKASAPIYFSPIAPLEADTELEAETLAVKSLRRLLDRNPAYQADFERAAAAALTESDLVQRAHAMRFYPGTQAAQKVLGELVAQADPMASGPRQIQLWHLADLAARLGLVLPPVSGESIRLAPSVEKAVALPGTLTEKRHAFPDSGENLRLILPIRTPGSGPDNRLFLGGRARKRLDNKFSLECWDLATWSRRWQQGDLRLSGTGDEPGFEEVFLAGLPPDARGGKALVITHGRHDVLAFGLEAGELAWRFRLPFDMDLRTVDQVGDLLVLAGTAHTLALQASTGHVVWQAHEQGEVYGRPFLRPNTLISVRRQPFNVTFRQLGSGQLLERLRLPDLNGVTRHPLLPLTVPGAAPRTGLPIACQGDLLVLNTGQYYLALDLAKREVRWKRPIDNNDLFVGPARFYLHEPFLLILKTDFDAPALYLLDSRTGEVLCRKKDSGVVHSIHFDEDGKTFVGLAAADPAKPELKVIRFNTATGAELARWSSGPLKEVPDADLVGRLGDGKVILRSIYGEAMELTVLDLAAGQAVARLSGRCVGAYGAHGGKAALWQGTHLLLMGPEQIQALVPKEAKP